MDYNFRDDPILGSAFAFWMEKRAGRLMPCKRDIDPVEIPPKILPNLQIIDVIDGGARFRYRLIGTALAEAYGRDFSGQHPDEMFPKDRLRYIVGIYHTICRTKAPLFSRNKYLTTKNIDLIASRIYMPLSEDGVNVHHILGVLRFEFSAALDSGMWGDEAQIDPEWYSETIFVAGSRALVS
jgi:hypothetical protein